MPMTTDQIYEARRWVGSVPPDNVLNDNYDRLGSVKEVVEEILQTRRADFDRQPSSLSLAGEFSQSISDTKTKELTSRLNQLEGADVTNGDSSPHIKRLVRYGDDPWPGR